MVVSAPSGAGKTSLARALVERHTDLAFSVSATTRAPRGAEQQGTDYYFVDDAEFDRMIESGELVEWAVVHGSRYGTPLRGIEEALAQGRCVVLDIDVQGARQIRRGFPDAVLVFILPPTAAELNRRLSGRATEDQEARWQRLRDARQELPAVTEFDYVIVNDDFVRAEAALEAVLMAERHAISRVTGVQRQVAALEAGLDQLMNRSD